MDEWMRGRKTVKLGWMEKGEYCKGDKGHIMRKVKGNKKISPDRLRRRKRRGQNTQTK